MEENESVVAMQERANALLREARESVSFSDVLTSHARGPSADRRGGSEPRASKAERLKEEQKNVVRAIAYAIGQFDRKALSDAVIDATAVGVKHKCVLQAALLKQSLDLQFGALSKAMADGDVGEVKRCLANIRRDDLAPFDRGTVANARAFVESQGGAVARDSPSPKVTKTTKKEEEHKKKQLSDGKEGSTLKSHPTSGKESNSRTLRRKLSLVEENEGETTEEEDGDTAVDEEVEDKIQVGKAEKAEKAEVAVRSSTEAYRNPVKLLADEVEDAELAFLHEEAMRNTAGEDGRVPSQSEPRCTPRKISHHALRELQRPHPISTSIRGSSTAKASLEMKVIQEASIISKGGDASNAKKESSKRNSEDPQQQQQQQRPRSPSSPGMAPPPLLEHQKQQSQTPRGHHVSPRAQSIPRPRSPSSPTVSPPALEGSNTRSWRASLELFGAGSYGLKDGEFSMSSAGIQMEQSLPTLENLHRQLDLGAAASALESSATEAAETIRSMTPWMMR